MVLTNANYIILRPPISASHYNQSIVYKFIRNCLSLLTNSKAAMVACMTFIRTHFSLLHKVFFMTCFLWAISS